MSKKDVEYFYYGRRLKAVIEIIKDSDYSIKMFVCRLYTYGMKEIENKKFFIRNKDKAEIKKEYLKCNDYVMDYLNHKCKY